MSWMEVKQGASDCMILTTTWNLKDGAKKKHVKFPRTQKGGIEVLCWIKDFRFRTWEDGPYSCDVWATNVTKDGFMANIDASEKAERVVATWIVYRKGKRKVASGTFSTQDVEGREDEAPRNGGRVSFPEGTFGRPSTVLVALSQFDLAGGRDMRLGAYISGVDKTGFDWELSTFQSFRDSKPG